MEKIILIILVLSFELISIGFADTDPTEPKNSVVNSGCKAVDVEIHNWEKDYSQNTQLLKTKRQEIEKLSSEASSTKMKLTSETFIIAAKLETAQNWLKVKRADKIKKNCPASKK